MSHKSVHKIPRYWSNDELKKFSKLFSGKIVNISAWEDRDKQGAFYKDYFSSASEYWTTNYKSEMRGFTGAENEIFLNLEEATPENLIGKFDTVFNHTTLEHVYDVHSAIDTLVDMTNDVLILVVPFLQQVHVVPNQDNGYDPEYGDFWRFTPQVIERLLSDRGMSICYLNFNRHRCASVYLFCIATKKPEKWRNRFPMNYCQIDREAVGFVKQPWAGCNAFRNSPIREFFKRRVYWIQRIILRALKKIVRIIGLRRQDKI